MINDAKEKNLALMLFCGVCVWAGGGSCVREKDCVQV